MTGQKLRRSRGHAKLLAPGGFFRQTERAAPQAGFGDRALERAAAGPAHGPLYATALARAFAVDLAAISREQRAALLILPTTKSLQAGASPRADASCASDRPPAPDGPPLPGPNGRVAAWHLRLGRLVAHCRFLSSNIARARGAGYIAVGPSEGLQQNPRRSRMVRRTWP